MKYMLPHLLTCRMEAINTNYCALLPHTDAVDASTTDDLRKRCDKLTGQYYFFRSITNKRKKKSYFNQLLYVLIKYKE